MQNSTVGIDPRDTATFLYSEEEGPTVHIDQSVAFRKIYMVSNGV